MYLVVFVVFVDFCNCAMQVVGCHLMYFFVEKIVLFVFIVNIKNIRGMLLGFKLSKTWKDGL